MAKCETEVHIHIHTDTSVQSTLDKILTTLEIIKQKEAHMAADLSTLTAEVQENSDVVDSAIILINNIAAELAAAGTDPVALAALAATLSGSTDELAAAVAANTPAETPPVV